MLSLHDALLLNTLKPIQKKITMHLRHKFEQPLYKMKQKSD